ncbi:TSL-kinase interacting protein [Trifolium repens]|nr:TSL-kinase interacting protein [Trifolium repens]
MPSAQIRLFGGRKMLEYDLYLYLIVTISARRNLFLEACLLVNLNSIRCRKKMLAEAKISTDSNTELHSETVVSVKNGDLVFQNLLQCHNASAARSEKTNNAMVCLDSSKGRKLRPRITASW